MKLVTVNGADPVDANFQDVVILDWEEARENRVYAFEALQTILAESITSDADDPFWTVKDLLNLVVER